MLSNNYVMEISVTENRLAKENLVNSLIKELKHRENELGLENSYLFNEFPVYKDLDEEIVIAQVLIISAKHGIILIQVDDSNEESLLLNKLRYIEDEIDNLDSILYTRLLKNKQLRHNKRDLLFPINTIIYTPLMEKTINLPESELHFCTNVSLPAIFSNVQIEDDIQSTLLAEIKSTIEGSKALIRTKVRVDVEHDSKGDLVNRLEKEIASFDQYQRSAYTSISSGVSRVRGLAGSGKTIVLAMKAALTHLKYPDAKIVYTFYTKSLYQYIKRLITRFYRQFQDVDPDWEKLEILHAWGSASTNGIYYNACKANEIIPISFTVAARNSSKSKAFEYVCDDYLEKNNEDTFLYDYIFIDEGQDFPSSFLKLCLRITKEKRIFWAYDELQTIFQPKSPKARDIFGVDSEGAPLVDFEEDIILYKCYRNPREIILVAHAMGFGIYGNIVQMITNSDYWHDIGYEIKSGVLEEGRWLKIERPIENSLTSVSSKFSMDEIIQIEKFDGYSLEIANIAKRISDDIKQGLLPEDVLVVCVDDRNASTYLRDIQIRLSRDYKIGSNNIHADKYSTKEFQIDDRVTLSTVHKAKGNEAYSVYVVGAEALFSIDPTIKERNILFTAMTRSKGWLYISGVGETMDLLINEIKLAKDKFPNLEFKYPSLTDLSIMERDIKDEAIRKSRSKKMIEDALLNLTPSEIKRYLEQITGEKKITE